MSNARKQLRRWAYSAGYIESELDAAADRMYALIAHELAEKIRSELPERVKKLTGDWAEIRTVSTAQHAADLIDPEVGKRCVNDTNGDGDCAACARNPEAPCRQAVNRNDLEVGDE